LFNVIKKGTEMNIEKRLNIIESRINLQADNENLYQFSDLNPEDREFFKKGFTPGRDMD
jgi:hypothetical protein